MLKTILLSGVAASALIATAAQATDFLTPGEFTYTASQAGYYDISVIGGAGGTWYDDTYGGRNAGGSGGLAYGRFFLTLNEQIDVRVGAQGSAVHATYGYGGYWSDNSASGGGESRVFQGGTTFLVSNGGAGGYYLGQGYGGYGYVIATSHNGRPVTDSGYGYAANTGDGSVTINFAGPAGVPEPSTWALLLSGFGFIGYRLRRRFVRLA